MDNKQVFQYPAVGFYQQPNFTADSKTQVLTAIKKNQELLAAKVKLQKNKNTFRTDILKMKNNVIRRKCELLEKQFSQQKILLAKMEKPGPQRDYLLKIIKKMEKVIRIGNKDLVQSIGEVKSRLQKKANEDLRLRLRSNTNSVNKTSSPNQTVDRRPTRLLVSGYETEEQESVLLHFQLVGEIIDYTVGPTLSSTTLTYKTRKEAEMAMLQGKHFHDRILSVTWCTEPITNQLISRPTSSKSSMSESEENRLTEESSSEGEEDISFCSETTEDDLFQDDEEDEDK
ncbi:hypothetical protein Zmor_018117 [Zophobas morio]|uniref:RRM domain-containing protein n=1 Tax=Zophobas morio TaxID=2755281 RepID=A0AA38IDI7_9CUCU|nr:hypothetical protein Zmor_018117 [Zophobas morio]